MKTTTTSIKKSKRPAIFPNSSPGLKCYSDLGDNFQRKKVKRLRLVLEIFPKQ